MNLKPLILCLLLTAAMSCSNEGVQTTTANGTIVDGSTQTGFESCGFLIRINGTLYKPTYLNLEYEQDGLDVFLKVEFLNQTNDCGGTNSISMLRIEQISPSN
ncbi:hypothetical protein [Roseivirga sp.]|uniref:hypothetical protein n=1 Tax=Roseivirga sp. TaxID=1964215 RepID=UPI003B8E6CBB